MQGEVVGFETGGIECSQWNGRTVRIPDSEPTGLARRPNRNSLSRLWLVQMSDHLLRGVAFSRRVAQRLHKDIAFRVLAANNTPDFRNVSDFSKGHLDVLVKLGHMALDGTKVRANATSPTPSPASCPDQAVGTSRRLTTVRRWWNHAHQVIGAAQATTQASDKQQTLVMIEETIDNTGVVPKEVSADAGYYSARTVADLTALGVDPYVAPEQTRHGRVPPAAPRGRVSRDLSPRTGCTGSCTPSGVANATAGVWRRWNRSPARSSRAEASASSCCGSGECERRVVADLHRTQPAQAVPLRSTAG